MKGRLNAEDDKLLDRALMASTEKLYDIEPAPAAVPSEEEIARVLYEKHCEEYRAEPWWDDELEKVKRVHRPQARAVLALFARVLEEKERAVRERAACMAVLLDSGPPDHQAEVLRIHGEKCGWMNRALAAEAALAEERATIERLHQRVIRKHLRELKAAGRPNVVDPVPRPPEPGGEAGSDRPLRPFR